MTGTGKPTTPTTLDLLYVTNGYAPDKVTLYRLVAQLIARLPREQHAGELGRLVAWLERCGVAVPEQWRCDLEERA